VSKVSGMVKRTRPTAAAFTAHAMTPGDLCCRRQTVKVDICEQLSVDADDVESTKASRSTAKAEGTDGGQQGQPRISPSHS
jgi:hypothetical protein